MYQFFLRSSKELSKMGNYLMLFQNNYLASGNIRAPTMQ